MKFCKDCKHLQNVIDCTKDVDSIDILTGKTTYKSVYAARNGSCGPEAKNFEAKVNLSTLINEILQRLR